MEMEMVRGITPLNRLSIKVATDKKALWSELSRDPAKVLFGNKAKRTITKIFLIYPDGEVSLKDLRLQGKTAEKDLIKAFREYVDLKILKKRRSGKAIYYYIDRESLMGRKYLEIVRSLAGVVVLATEMTE